MGVGVFPSLFLISFNSIDRSESYWTEMTRPRREPGLRRSHHEDETNSSFRRNSITISSRKRVHNGIVKIRRAFSSWSRWSSLWSSRRFTLKNIFINLRVVVSVYGPWSAARGRGRKRRLRIAKWDNWFSWLGLGRTNCGLDKISGINITSSYEYSALCAPSVVPFYFFLLVNWNLMTRQGQE